MCRVFWGPYVAPLSADYQIEMQEMDRPEAFSDVFDRVQAETVAEVPDEEFNAQQGEEA